MRKQNLGYVLVGVGGEGGVIKEGRVGVSEASSSEQRIQTGKDAQTRGHDFELELLLLGLVDFLHAQQR